MKASKTPTIAAITIALAGAGLLTTHFFDVKTPARIDFSEEIELIVWKKAAKIEGRDPQKVRLDKCGAVIEESNYGKLTETGWEIDHILPVKLDGTHAIENLQPLHWRNNRAKGAKYPVWRCKVPKKETPIEINESTS